MAELNQEQGQTDNAAAGDPSPAKADVTTPAPDGPQAFVPYFNEEYEFKLGALGDVDTAYRLGAIFVLMLVGAVMMYMCAWWWVGTHPLAQQQ